MALTRRGILIGALAGGGLAVGYLLRPRRYEPPLSAGQDEAAFGAWIRIGANGVITVAVPQLEMGQGITTLIPQIVAVELGADWRQIAVEPVPPSPLYVNLPLAARWAELWMPAVPRIASAGNPITRRWAQDHAFTATADGQSLAAYEYPARAAAAAARSLLMQAAAARWDADWRQCDTKDGFVVHAGIRGDRRLPFGTLAAEAAGFDPPRTPPLRRAAAKEGANAPLRFPRLDLPSKVDGSHLFAGDVRLPGMVHAAIRHGPIGDTVLAGFEKARAQGIPGLISLVRGKRWLAAVAETWWAAERALAEIAPNFIARDRADSGRIETALDTAVRRGAATRLFERGDPDALAGGFSLVTRYDVAPALHATLETASATARLADGRLELWLASQAPEAARRAAAEAAGVPLRNCVLYPMPAGGSFDRRLEHDHAIEAATIARAVGRPVQLTWSRWQEHVAGPPRPPVAAVLAARTDPSGAVAGWKARLALPATGHEFGRRLFAGRTGRQAMAESAGEADLLAMDGVVPPYAVPDMAIEHVPADIGLPTGRLRGNAHGYAAFFTESFVDELAHQTRQEPLAFRIAMLGHDPRLIACLQRVAVQADWGGGVEASGQGIACHVIGANAPDGARIAAVATARRGETGVRIDRIDAVADIGRIVNLDIARQQIEGGLVYGIGLALGSSTAYADGLPTVGRLAELALPVLADCPEIRVAFVDSDAPPADPGELGVAVAAPVLANALFSATGLRFRRLPLLSEEI
ncbi:MAG: molybdopterin cofactor-binding domain-containing protein [Novosphingobium sp.]